MLSSSVSPGWKRRDVGQNGQPDAGRLVTAAAGLVLHVIIKELQQVRPVFRILLVAPLLLVVDPEPLFPGADPAEALKGAVAVDLVAFTLALKVREFVKKLERSWN